MLSCLPGSPGSGDDDRGGGGVRWGPECCTVMRCVDMPRRNQMIVTNSNPAVHHQQTNTLLQTAAAPWLMCWLPRNARIICQMTAPEWPLSAQTGQATTSQSHTTGPDALAVSTARDCATSPPYLTISCRRSSLPGCFILSSSSSSPGSAHQSNSHITVT